MPKICFGMTFENYGVSTKKLGIFDNRPCQPVFGRDGGFDRGQTQRRNTGRPDRPTGATAGRGRHPCPGMHTHIFHHFTRHFTDPVSNTRCQPKSIADSILQSDANTKSFTNPNANTNAVSKCLTYTNPAAAMQ